MNLSTATHRTRLFRTLLIALVAISLSGCSILQVFVPPKSFEYVNQVRDELELETVGEVQVENESGGEGATDAGPRYIAIITGDDAAATLESRLLDRGYTHGKTLWEKRFDDSKVVTIYFEQVSPGDEVEMGENETARVEADGVMIFIQG